MELTAFNEIINNISKMDNLQKQRLYTTLKNIKSRNAIVNRCFWIFISGTGMLLNFWYTVNLSYNNLHSYYKGAPIK